MAYIDSQGNIWYHNIVMFFIKMPYEQRKNINRRLAK